VCVGCDGRCRNDGGEQPSPCAESSEHRSRHHDTNGVADMRNLRALLVRAFHFFGRTRRERDFSSELEAHLQAHIADNVRAGMTPEDARRDALLALGGRELTKNDYRDQRGLPMIEHLMRELRHSGSRLMRSPGFTAAAVLSLALAIGANVSVATIVERIV